MQPLSTNDFDENYDRFIVEAIETGIVWGLENDEGWAICPSVDNEDIDVMPFWSSQDHASACCSEEWASYRPQAIDIEEFLDDWLPGLHEDVIMVGTNWTADMDGVEIQPLDLAEELEDEMGAAE